MYKQGLSSVLRGFACAAPLGLATLISQTAFAQSIATYSFDETSGTTLTDRSGNNFNGALQNGPVWSSGKYAGGLSFDGSNDYVALGDVARVDGLTSFTVSAWIKFASAGGGAAETHLIDKSKCNGYGNGGPFELGVSLSHSRKAEFVIYPAGAVPAALIMSGASTTSVDDGQWHHVTGRYDGNDLSIWVNGVQENAVRAPGLRTTNTSYQLELGGNCNGYHYLFKGTMDDVRIYDRALSQAEIRADMAQSAGDGSIPPPADTSAPSTPSAPQASSVTSSSVTLSWQASSDNVGVSGYRIYRNGQQVRTSQTTTVSDTGLSPGTAYSYRVAAYDAAGNVSAQSSALTVTTAPTSPPADTSPPSSPTALQSSSVTSTSLTLSWQASTDNTAVTGYRIFRNGTQVATTSATTLNQTGLTPSTAYSFRVAAHDAAGNVSTQSSAHSVTTSASSTPPPPTTPPPSNPPFAAYGFGEGSGTTLVDQSGNGYNGTLRNGPVWSAGKTGGGLTFDGSNDYVTMGDTPAADGLNRFTVSTWVKFTNSGGAASEVHLVDKSQCSGHSNGGPWELGVSFSRAHKAEFIIYPAGGSPAALVFSGASTTSVDDGQWHHVTGRYDGSYLSIWVDGNQESSFSAPGLTMPNTSSSLELGGNCNGYVHAFRGTLDDVRIYNRALSQSEIQSDMATSVGGGTTPPPSNDTTPPSTPSNVRSSNIGSTSVVLTWNASTDNSGVAGYRIFRNGAQVLTTSSTNVTDSGLTSNTSYSYTVLAYDAAGNVSAHSSALLVTTGTTTPPPTGGTYSTNFNANENPVSEGGRWRRANNNWTNVQTVGGVAFGTNGVTNTYDDSYALLSGFGADQSVEAVVFRDQSLTPGDTHEVELLLRFSDDAGNARGYECLFDYHGWIMLVRWNGQMGDFTTLRLTEEGYFPRHLQTGDVIRATITGNVISAYINGQLIARAVDSTHTSGQPGMGFFIRPNGSQRLIGLTSFTASSP
jgi:chitodextrinase